MTHDENFYSPLTLENAKQRLQGAHVTGVKIHVKQANNNQLHFRFDLLKALPIGKLTQAHLQGTIQRVQDNHIHIEYHSRALFPHAVAIVPAITIAVSLILLGLLPPQLLIISAMPLIVGVLFALFWSFFRDSMKEGDRHRLQELLGRMLEKSSSMSSWQG